MGIAAIQSSSGEAYIKRNNGTWSKGKYVPETNHLGRRQGLNSGTGPHVGRRDCFSLNPTDKHPTPFKIFIPTNKIAVISDVAFQVSVRRLGEQLSVTDEAMKQCFASVFEVEAFF